MACGLSVSINKKCKTSITTSCKLKSAAEGRENVKKRERGNERKLEPAKTCKSKTAQERLWKHCRISPASACLDLSEIDL